MRLPRPGFAVRWVRDRLRCEAEDDISDRVTVDCCLAHRCLDHRAVRPMEGEPACGVCLLNAQLADANRRAALVERERAARVDAEQRAQRLEEALRAARRWMAFDPAGCEACETARKILGLWCPTHAAEYGALHAAALDERALPGR